MATPFAQRVSAALRILLLLQSLIHSVAQETGLEAQTFLGQNSVLFRCVL